MEKQMIDALSAPLPKWAITKHPTKTFLSVIHPMAVVDRLNSVFGVGEWGFEVENLGWVGSESKSGKTMYSSAVKGRLVFGETVIEQFGGSSNDDLGDALKGGATDALTKCASYLGVGASIYKGQGNGEEDTNFDVVDDLDI